MTASAFEASLRADLAGDDEALSGVVPVLSHLLAHPGEAMVSDDIIAKMRGLIGSIAYQLLTFQDGEGPPADIDALSVALASNGSLVTHCFAIAVEGAIALELGESRILDPVLPPLLRELIGSQDKHVAELAVALMASQARFCEAQKRSEARLNELPAELFDDVLTSWKAWARRQPHLQTAKGEPQLRASYDEAKTRLGLLGRLISAIGASGELVCELETAGLAVFCSAIAGQTRQPRELVVLSCQPQQALRLAVTLKACGNSEESIMRQFEFMGSDVSLPHGFDEWASENAALVLTNSPLGIRAAQND